MPLGLLRRFNALGIGALACAAVLAPSAPTAAQTPPVAAPAAAPAAAGREPNAAEAKALATAIGERKAGRFEAALTAFKALVALAPELPRAWHELGLLYAIHGQFDEAQAAFERALELGPDARHTRLALAEILRADAKFIAASGHYRRLLAGATDGERLTLGKSLALCALGAGNADAARAELQSLVATDGEGETGRWARERLAALDAAAQTPGDAAEVDREVERLIAAGRAAEAADLAGLACREAPSGDRCYREAVAALAVRDYLRAAMALRAALRADPNHLASRSAWPTTLRKLRSEGVMAGQAAADDASSGDGPTALPGGLSPALRCAQVLRAGDTLLAEKIATAPALGDRPGAALLFCRAEARLRRGDSRRARTDFEALLTQRPGHELARIGIAITYWQEGRAALARSSAGLPVAEPLPMGVELPDGYDGDADLRALQRWQRDEADHRLAMALDPGRRPRPARQEVLLLDVEALRPPAPVLPAAPDPGARGRKRR